MQTSRVPYELLFRWNTDGALVGAHVQWRYVIRDESGAVVSESVSVAQPVSVGAGEGFPVADLLSEALQGALARLDAVDALKGDD